MSESFSAVIPTIRTLLNEIFGGRSLSWFWEHRSELEANGFPKRDPLIGGWSRLAVGRWEAKRAGVDFPGDNPQPSTPSSGDRELKRRLEALSHHGEDHRASSA